MPKVSIKYYVLRIMGKSRKSQDLHNTYSVSHTTNLGFTLIELLVVIAIIAVLASIGIVVYSTSQKTARISKRLQDLKAIQTAVETYKSTNGFYPKVAAVGVCVTNATNGLAKSLSPDPNFIPSYMPSMPTDPSGGK